MVSVSRRVSAAATLLLLMFSWLRPSRGTLPSSEQELLELLGAGNSVAEAAGQFASKVKGKFNSQRLIVVPKGSNGDWEWPDMAVRNMTYRFRAAGNSSAFGVLQLNSSDVLSSIVDIYTAIKDLDVFSQVSLDYQVSIDQATRTPTVLPGVPVLPSLTLPNDPSQQLVLGDLQTQTNMDLSMSLQDVVPEIPDDPLAPQQWYLETLGSGYNTALNRNGQGVIVAVMDTGCPLGNPDLLPNLWVNEGEIADNGIDDDNNGYVDDYFGYNFVSDNAIVQDDNGHGSHVAGIIAAVANNNLAIAGVAPSTRIMCLKFMDETGLGYQSDVISAIGYAIQMKAHIENHSWGAYSLALGLKNAVESAGAYGHLLVTAAGNDGLDTDQEENYHVPSGFSSQALYPEMAPYVLSVAASDALGALASFSNYGTETVDMAAPGVGIVSLSNSTSGVAIMSGTSQATPMVSAVAAVTLSVLAARAAEDVFGEDEVFNPAPLKSILMQTSLNSVLLEGYVGTGAVVNAILASQYAATGNLTSSEFVQTLEPPAAVGGLSVLEWALIGCSVAAVVLAAVALYYWGKWWWEDRAVRLQMDKVLGARQQPNAI